MEAPMTLTVYGVVEIKPGVFGVALDVNALLAPALKSTIP
jgi:hypothetical protein